MAQTKAQLIDYGTAVASSVPTNGPYLAAANTVAISTNGAGRLFINSAGSVGIGTSSPAKLLEVNEGDIQIRNSSTASLSTLLNYGLTFRATNQVGQDRGTIAEIKPYLGGNSDNDFGFQFRTQATTAGGVTTKMTLTPGGSLGIGTTSPSTLLHLRGSLPELRIDGDSTNGVGGLKIYNSATELANFTYSNVSGENRIGGIQSYVFPTFYSGGSERARIDTAGRLLVGTSSARSNFFNSTFSAQLQIEGTTSSDAVAAITRSSVDTAGPILHLAKSRSAVGGNGLVASGDQLGVISFQGSEGTKFVPAAYIEAFVDATPGANDMPGRLVFSTTLDGASTPTERMRITNIGQTIVFSNNNLGISGAGYAFQASNTSASTSGVATYHSSLGSAGSANNTNCAHFYGVTQGVGFYYLYGNGTSSFTSDARKKKNIEATRDGYLEDLSRLRVVKYNWINQAEGDPKELGLIAQEVEEVFPGLVQEAGKLEGDDFNCKVLKGSVLPFMLLKALQEAAEKIERLEAKVAALETA